jgi:hypothetical protein
MDTNSSDETCPKCGHARTPDALECPACGIVYARFRPRTPPPLTETDWSAEPTPAVTPPPPVTPDSPYAPPASWETLEKARGMPAGIPEPPGGSWVSVLLLSAITCGIYAIVKAFQQARYAKKLDPENKAGSFYGAYVALTVAATVLRPPISRETVPTELVLLMQLGSYVCFQIGSFQIRATLQEKLPLTLTGVMTFFFNTFYFQYHLRKMADERMPSILAA